MRVLFWLFAFLLLVGAWLTFSDLGQLIVQRFVNYEPFPNEPNNWQISRENPGSLDEGEYYFGTTNPKEIRAAYITGTDCNNLKAAIFAAPNSNEGFIYGAKMGPKEKAQREKWHSERGGLYKTRLMCLPPVKNIDRFLKENKAFVSYNGIFIENGPILIVRPDKEPYGYSTGFQGRAAGLPDTAEKYLGRYREIKDIFPCSDLKNEFCVHMDIYEYNFTTSQYQLDMNVGQTGDYRIFCWDCDKVRKAAKHDLRKAMLFRAGVFQAYILDGGMMVTEQFLGKPIIRDFVRESLSKKMDVDKLLESQKRGGSKTLDEIRQLFSLTKAD